MCATTNVLAIAVLTLSLGGCVDSGDAAPAETAMSRAEIEQAIMAVQAAWPAASVAGDCEAAAQLRADDFVQVNSSGTVVRKAEWLERCRANQGVVEMSENVEVELHAASPEYAVTTGLNNSRGRDAQGNQTETWTRWTNVWAHRDGRWVAVAAHQTALPGRP